MSYNFQSTENPLSEYFQPIILITAILKCPLECSAVNIIIVINRIRQHWGTMYWEAKGMHEW